MRLSITLLTFFIFSVTGFCQSASELQPEYVSGEVAIRLNAGVSINQFIVDFNNEEADFKIELKRTVIESWNLHSLNLIPANYEVPAAAEILDNQNGVAHAFADKYVKSRTQPNDPSYFRQWSFDRIGLEEVWELTTGGKNTNGHDIVVAVLDSGFDETHDDLQGNLWKNPGEIPADGIDNDGNGYIDDVCGYNFQNGSPVFTPAGHGTAVSGVVGAKGDNNKNIAGVNWNVKMMLLEVGSFTSVYEGYNYAMEQRKKFRETNGEEGALIVVTNSSFGQSDSCENAIEFNIAYEDLGQEGILSAAATTNSSANIDLIGDIPTSCMSDFLITVANANENDELRESGFGKESIDLGAPGKAIHTLWIGNGEKEEKGTSMSTPHVAGAIALLYSLPCTKLAEESLNSPRETALAMKNFILSGVDKLSTFEGKTVSGGRLNVKNSMDLINAWCKELFGDFAVEKIYPNPTLDELTVLYSSPDLETFTYRIHNSIGQLVYEGEIVPDPTSGGENTIGVAHLAAGTYVISFEKGGETISHSFVKI